MQFLSIVIKLKFLQAPFDKLICLLMQFIQKSNLILLVFAAVYSDLKIERFFFSLFKEKSH